MFTALILAASAGAAAPPPPPPREHWYGGAIVFADLASLSLATIGLLTTASARTDGATVASATLFGTGLLVYAGVPQAIHAANGHSAVIPNSLAWRLALGVVPPATVYTVSAADTCADGSGEVAVECAEKRGQSRFFLVFWTTVLCAGAASTIDLVKNAWAPSTVLSLMPQFEPVTRAAAFSIAAAF